MFRAPKALVEVAVVFFVVSRCRRLVSWLNLEVTCEGIRPLLERGTASDIAQRALGVEVTVVLFVVFFRGRRRCRRRRCPCRRCV